MLTFQHGFRPVSTCAVPPCEGSDGYNNSVDLGGEGFSSAPRAAGGDGEGVGEGWGGVCLGAASYRIDCAVRH